MLDTVTFHDPKKKKINNKSQFFLKNENKLDFEDTKYANLMFSIWFHHLIQQ